MQIQFKTGKSVAVLPRLKEMMGVSGESLFIADKQINKVKVSAVLITFNEASIIEETVSRLWWCDEIIIVDSGSTDRTMEICKEYGCRIFTHPFKGFGEQKQYGVAKASNDWILSIDADELLTDELISEIRKELSSSNIDHSGFSIPRNLVFMDRVFNRGKESNAHVLRLFNKTKGNWDNAIVHERVNVQGAVKKLNHRLLHYSFKDYAHFINKINLYSSLGAQKLARRQKSKSKLVIALSIPFNFFKYYIIDRNFLNGFRGFTWSALNTWYHFLKYLKLEETRRRKQKLQNH